MKPDKQLEKQTDRLVPKIFTGKIDRLIRHWQKWEYFKMKRNRIGEDRSK